MKKIYLTLAVLTISTGAFSQSTAQDWTNYDCNGNSHTLFTYLDNSEVVVMEFGMGCSSCSSTGTWLDGLKQQYDASNPGKVNFFYMDYWNGNDCVNDVTPFMTNYNLSWPAFEHCDTELTYYMTGSPMPAIVIAAGTFHAVYYEKNSFTNNDTTAIIAAINQALDDMDNVGIEENVFTVEPMVYPNPAGEQCAVRYTLQNNAEVAIDLFNVLGEKVMTVINQNQSAGQYDIKLEIKTIPAGQYILKMKAGNSQKTISVNIQH
jgi:hypothetical protein